MIRRVVGGIVVLGLFGLVVGCHKSNPSSPATPPPGPAMVSASPGGGQGEFDTESGPHAAGKKALVANGCFRCHTVNGVRGPVGGGAPPVGGPPGGEGGGPPMGAGGPGPGGRGGPGGPGMGPGGRRRAPDLGEVAKDPEHTADWIMRFVRNPQAVKPESKGMPRYEGRIQDDDLRALADYLVSLK